MSKANELRELIKKDKMYVLPGVSNAFFANLVEEAGYEIIYISGAAISNMNFNLPDYNMITMTENLEIAKRINDAVRAPVICDIDNGYGGYINVYRTLLEYSKVGIAGVQLEDQQNPKRCGHFEDHAVIPVGEMVGKIKAARDGAVENTFILARTDALSATGSFDEAVDRMGAYLEAGADGVFIEAVKTVDQMKRIPQIFAGKPCLVNLVEHGKTPFLNNSEYEAMGFKFALYAAQHLKAAAFGVNNYLAYLKEHGTTEGADDVCMITSEMRHIYTHKEEYKNRIAGYEKIYKTRE